MGSTPHGEHMKTQKLEWTTPTLEVAEMNPATRGPASIYNDPNWMALDRDNNGVVDVCEPDGIPLMTTQCLPS